MNRISVLLTALGLLAVVALFFVFVFQPARDEVVELEDRIASEQQQQTQLLQDINRLREVREQAPVIESGLATAAAIVPDDAALPPLVRQLQAAADDAGMVLSSLSTGRPAPLPETTEPGLSAIDLSAQMSGTYFQMVDFLRRIEEPSITARGITWNSISVSRADEAYPILQFSVSGRAYAVIQEPVAEDALPPPEAQEDDTAGDDDFVEEDLG